MTSSTGEILDVAQQAVDRLAPETGLVADVDSVLFSRAMIRTARGLARNPVGLIDATARAAGGLTRTAAAALLRAAGDTSAPPITGDRKDRRFADDAWSSNPFFFALWQAYAVAGTLMDELIDAGSVDTDASAAGKARIYGDLLINAMAPTNFLLTNPAALKHAFDTAGRSLLKGARNLIDDMFNNDGRPRQVDTRPFTVGVNLAATPGRVVFRNELIEVLQYQPQTEKVHEIPVLCSPPWINKYYIMDLAPGRSFIEWMVTHGHTVFAISYRNPDETMAETTLHDYMISGPRAALDVVCDITGSDKVNMVGLCMGGALLTMLTAYLNASGDKRINSITLLNTLLDYTSPGDLSSFTDIETVERLEAKMAKQGYLEASEMSGTFDILRSNDLIFNYVVSNWLMGQDPPAFDILTWNVDSTRLPAAMHSFYLRSCYVNNEFAQGQLELGGRRLDITDVDQDVFIVAAVNDHIVPWKSSYLSTGLLPGDVQFVLSSSGHIAGIVNPPSPKARYWTASQPAATADQWFEDATQHQDTWWNPWLEWMKPRAGAETDPPTMGSEKHAPLGDAPGEYVTT